MIEIKGLDEQDRRLTELQQRAQALSEPHGVSFDKLFPPTFMAEHTEFRTIKDMTDESGLFTNADDQDAAHTVLNGQEWNDFVGRRTQFSGWEEMLSTAGTVCLSQELFDGLA